MSLRRRPQEDFKQAISQRKSLSSSTGHLGLVLSGGGARAAYQVGALKALIPYLSQKGCPFSIVIGSSIGAINGLILSACLVKGFEQAVHALEDVWRERTFRNTFGGSPSRAFFKAIKVATLQYVAPGPNPTDEAIFDPTPLMDRVNEVIADHGGLSPDVRAPELMAVAVMTTLEGAERKPLLFLSTHKKLEEDTLKGASFEICYRDELSAKHGFASAALPSILPPVELDTEEGTIRAVDGGISQNVPVDPAVRLGAERVIVVDISGRNWWLDKYGESHDTRPTWEVAAKDDTFCLRPPETFILRNPQPFGPILKSAIGKSTVNFITSVGPIWPIFKLLKNKLGEDVAYEVMSYCALHPDFLHGLIERGFEDTTALLRHKTSIEFEQPSAAYEEFIQAI